MKLLQEAEELFHRVELPLKVASTLGDRALILEERGDTENAISALKMQEQIYRDLDRPDLLAENLGRQVLLINVAGGLKTPNDLLLLLNEQEQLYRRTGNHERLAQVMGAQALLAKARGDLSDAIELFRQKEAILRRMGDQVGVRRALEQQAEVLLELGEVKQAAALLKEGG